MPELEAGESVNVKQAPKAQNVKLGEPPQETDRENDKR
jgi:hypothetical protein